MITKDRLIAVIRKMSREHGEQLKKLVKLAAILE